MFPGHPFGGQEQSKMKKLGSAVQEVGDVFDPPTSTPGHENTNPSGPSPPSDWENCPSTEQPTRSPNLRPQNSCERSKSEDKRRSGLTPTPFISQLALADSLDKTIASTYQTEMETITNVIRNEQAILGTHTPAAARPLLRRSTSDALRASQQKLQQLKSAMPVVERPATPGVVSPTPVHRSRSSTYTTFCNDDREPQKDKSSSYLPHPSHEPRPEAPQSPSFLDNLESRRRPLLPHRTPSHEVQKRERALRAELETLRGQLSSHEQRRERETVAVNFALNRILEQQNNQMQVQQLLLQKLAGMDLQADQGIQECAAAEDEAGQHAKDVLEAEQGVHLKEESGIGWTAKADAEAEASSSKHAMLKKDSVTDTVPEMTKKDEDTSQERVTKADAEVDHEWKARSSEG